MNVLFKNVKTALGVILSADDNRIAYWCWYM